jgi:hypothetical protein
MVIMRNLENSSVDVSLSVPGQVLSNMKEQFSGETLSWKQEGGGVTTRVKLQAGEVRVYRE